MACGRTFEQIANARCATGSILLGTASLSTHSALQCAHTCQLTPSCNAASFECRTSLCQLFVLCLHLEATRRTGSILMHRHGRGWPTEPNRVRWTASVALVVASYGSDLQWLRRLPANATDLVVLRKTDFGMPITKPSVTPQTVLGLLSRYELCMDQNRTGQLDASLNAARTMSRSGPRVGRQWQSSQCRPNCACTCSCGDRLQAQRPHLAYFRAIPNYGITAGPLTARGGSREPSAYLTFLLDFRGNLPPVIIFTQDDCGKRFWFLCRWGAKLTHLHFVLRHMETFYGSGSHWRPPDRANCQCEYVFTNYSFGPIASPLFGISHSTQEVGWPQKAIFAVSRDAILAQDPSLFKILLRLVIVEGNCGPSTLSWSHTLERSWFLIFNRQPKHVPSSRHHSCIAESAMRINQSQCPAR
jgi:hypothetical protein